MKRVLLSCCCTLLATAWLTAQCSITHVTFKMHKTLENQSDIKLELMDADNQRLMVLMWEGNLTSGTEKIFDHQSIQVGGAAQYHWKLTEFDLLFDDDYGTTQSLHLNSSKHATFWSDDKTWSVTVRVNCE